MKRTVTESELPETLGLPRIDTLEQAERFVSGAEVPDIADLDALGVYTDGYYKVRRRGEEGISFARTTVLGVRESLSPQEFARLKHAADPEYWVLTTEVREALILIMAAHDLSRIPDTELLEQQPRSTEEAAAMLRQLQIDAEKRLKLDQQIRLRKEQPDQEHAAHAGNLGVASSLAQPTDSASRPDIEQAPAPI